MYDMFEPAHEKSYPSHPNSASTNRAGTPGIREDDDEVMEKAQSFTHANHPWIVDVARDQVNRKIP